MARENILAIVAVCFFDKILLHNGISHVRLCEFDTEGFKLVSELRRAVEAGMAGVGYLELVVDKHAEIVVEGALLQLLVVVLVIKIFKFAHAHVLAVDGH